MPLRDTDICHHRSVVYRENGNEITCDDCEDFWVTKGYMSAQEFLDCARLDAAQNLGEE